MRGRRLRRGTGGLVEAGRRLRATAAFYEGSPTLLARHSTFGVLRRLTPLAMVEGGGMRYIVRTDDTLGLRLWVSRHFEQDLMASALGFAGGVEGRTFVDVGANLGTSTIPALKVFGADHAVAFEPMASNVELLRCNLLLNGVEGKVDVHQVAVSDHDGTELMEVASENSGDHRVRRAELEGAAFGEPSRPTVELPAARLDHFVETGELDLDRVGLVWVDVQGSEGLVLAGARALMSRDEPLPFVVEFWPYGLRRCGGLELLCDLVSEHFATAVDVRASAEAGRRVEVPASEVSSLVDRYEGITFTDLVLLR